MAARTTGHTRDSELPWTANMSVGGTLERKNERLGPHRETKY